MIGLPLRRALRAILACLLVAGTAAATTLPTGFQDTVVLSGLTEPTAVRFAGDGRVFVAEKSGIIKVFPNLGSTTPTIFADLRTNVHNYWDRGLLGLELHPNFPATPYVYVLYTLDAAIGGTPPRWGTFGGTVDDCPTPPGPTTDGCPVAGRLSRLTALGNQMTGTEQVLLENWCQQFPSHSIGTIAFGADGALYVGSGEGADFNNVDYGQHGIPKNPCDDPPTGSGGTQLPPSARGGALRSQNLGVAGFGQVAYGGKVLRIDPISGAALPDNPLAGSPTAGQDRVIAYGFRNPFRLTPRPGTNEIWVGDVGWSTWEEIDRISDPTGSVSNFGWPCYEGPTIQQAYSGTNLTTCSLLYNNPGTTLGPLFAWNHSSHVGTGDHCGTGSSSVSGLAFYNGGGYPPNYNGALFFADYSRNCIWTMLEGAGGDPDPSTRAAFAEGAPGPVDLEIGPGGDLFYVDLNGGKVHRIQSFSTNQAPVAVIESDVTGGALPLTIHFDASASYDPESGPVTYSWDLNGDGVFGDSTAVAPQFTYNAVANVTVGLEVTDALGAKGVTFLDITPGSLPPVVTILTPADGSTWNVGSSIAFSGQAVDPQDGLLAPSRLTWQLIMHHCPSDCHTHPLQFFPGIAGASFAAPDHSYPSYLELQLTATNSRGLSATTSIVLLPNTVTLNFQTSPSGFLLNVGPSTSATPFSTTAIRGSHNSLSAPLVQALGSLQYYFSSWSDGGAASHDIVASGSSTFTASYGSVPPTIYGAPTAYATANETHGVTTGDFDGDGDLDIAAANHLSSNVSVLRGNGDGTFQAAVNYLVGNGPKSVAVGDFNKDGKLDLVTGNQEGDNVSVLLGNGNATFQPRVDYNTCARAHEVAVADLNGDGKQDLAVACWGGSVISVLLGNGNGTFQAAVNYAAGSAPHSIVARDFDGDGLLDLAVANHTGDNLSVLRGNGNGTFQPPVNYAVGVGPHSLRAADLNFDGRFDLAVVDDGSDDAEVLLNNGDGTFATPLSFATGSVPKGIGLGDLNGDGIPDIVATNTAGNYPTCCHPGGDKVQVLLGNGDGTFGPPVTYTVGTTPFGVAIADLNGDGLQDLVTANWHSNNVTVLLNGNPGGLPTTTTLVQTTSTTTTITALTTSTSTSSTTSTTIALPSPWLHQDIGAVGLSGSAGLSGTTFSIGASGNDIWDTADAFHFVYQPWTGDVDIVARVASVPATDPWAKAGVMIRESLTAGARHAMVVATSANGIAFQRRTATSGLTTHTSGPAAAAPYWVRLTRSSNTFSAYASANGSTWTLIGTDSIPMATAVFVGMPVTSHNNTVRGFATLDNVSLTGPTPNVPPTVSLTSPSNGASYTAPATVALAATAADSDGNVDHVDFYAGPTLIGSDSTAPYGLSWSNVPAGNYTLTAIATDNGGLSTTSAPIGITVTGGAGTLPPPWAQADIGSVAYAGTGTFAGGTFTMTGSGNDIWDFADAFHFVYQPLTGDGEIIARVATLQNTNAWAKAGVMIRETLTAGSRHAMIVVTTGNGVAFQRRTATGGLTSHTSGPSTVAPYWVRLTRSGSTFTAYASANGSSWTQVGIDSIPMAASVYVGLPVTSHDNTLVTTATVDSVSLSGGVAPTTTTTLPPATTTTTSTSSTSTSSTSTTAPVPTTTSTSTSTTSTSTSSSTSTTASTSSTSSTTPVPTTTSTSTSTTSTSTSSSTSTTASTTSTSSTSTSSSTSSTSTSSSTSSTSTSTSSTSTSSTSTTAPVPTTTSTSTTSTSTSSSTSTTASTTSTSSTSTSSSTSSTAPVPTTTSSTTSSTSTSTSSTNSTSTTSSTTVTSSTSTSTSSTSTTLPPTTTTTSSTTTTTAPSGWTDQDIGSVGVAGGVTLANGTFSVTGSGADIWNTADAFHFVYQQLSGDGQIVARVASVQNTDAWAKAGVMIRASLAAGSAQAFMAVTPGNGVVYQRRTTTGGITTHSPGPVTTAPYWVRLVRAGNVVTGYASADGSTWTAIGSDTLPLGTTAYFGLAVTSHNNGVLCLSTFDNVSLGTLAQSLPPPWLDADVGGVGAPGAGTYANGTFTATGSGADIWGTTDAFHLIYRPLAGDGQITARVATVPSTDPWGKAGVMIRETLATGSAHGMMIVSNARGAAFQWRSATGGASSNIAGPAVTAPYWVRLVRSGNLISAYASANGTTFTLVGSATIPMAANVLVGLPVTSHNNLLVGTATFTNVQ